MSTLVFQNMYNMICMFYLIKPKKMIKECKYIEKRVGKVLELNIYKIYKHKR